MVQRSFLIILKFIFNSYVYPGALENISKGLYGFLIFLSRVSIGLRVHQFNTSKLGYFRLLTKVYPSCDDTSKYACFVMDNAGFLVLHVDFMQSSATELHLGHVHITKKEKHIAEDLISKRFLVKKECRNVEAIQKQSFYEVNVPPSGVDELRGNSTCKYKVAPISGTNVYLGNQEQYSVAIFTTDFISPWRFQSMAYESFTEAIQS